MTFDAASVAVSSTTARLEYARIENIAPTSMSSTTSPVSEPKMTWTPAAWVKGLAASTISCSAMMISPKPIRMWPKRPAFAFSRVRYSSTPTKMRSGDNHDRSNEKTRTIRLVPTSAPSITASAGAVALKP